jgi:hypothetical protein
MNVNTDVVSRLTTKRDLQWVWGGVLIAATIVLSGKFACAVPFAALAALAALASDRKGGFLLIGMIWFVNQALGFAFLNYPFEFQSIAWGLMPGVSAFLSLLAARFAIDALRGFNALIGAGGAFVAAFCAYEGSLLAADFVVPSSEADFAWPVIKQIVAINAVSFAVLFCGYRALLAAGFLRGSLLPASGRDFQGAKPQTV